MRCDGCKLWLKEKDSYGAIKGLGECKKVVMLWEATEWTKDEDGEDDYCNRTVKPELVGQMSFVSDASQYHATLWTKPQFFCAHFEAP